MNDRGDEQTGDATRRGAGLRAVVGAAGPVTPPPPVRLLREWKGPTVADLLRDEFAARLPGEVRSALQHIEAGDLAAADAELPGGFAPILPGPSARRRPPRRRAFVVAAALALAALAAAAIRGGW